MNTNKQTNKQTTRHFAASFNNKGATWPVLSLGTKIGGTIYKAIWVTIASKRWIGVSKILKSNLKKIQLTFGFAILAIKFKTLS